MATFQIKSNLPDTAQKEIDRITALPVTTRTTAEANYLLALAPYLSNEIIDYDADGLITKAAGYTLPSTYTGFKKGALFIDKDAATNGLYQNTGDQTSATWTQIIDTDTDVNTITTGTPVNAVAATKVLTVGGIPADNNSVSIGGVVYTFESAIGVAVAATGTLTLGANAANANTVVIGANTYTFKTTLTEKKATGTLTATGNFVDGETVTIGGKTYVFTVNLSAPAVANEVKIGSNASDSLDNLIAAINGAAGAGTTYGTGTVAHTTVDVVAGAADTMTVTAKVIGTAGNAIATTVSAASCSFAQTTLTTGAESVANEIFIGAAATNSIDNLIAAIMAGSGAGTTYSTATVVHPTVTAAVGDGDTMGVTAKTAGEAGNAIATTDTLADGGFGAGTLTGGEDTDAANMVLIGASAEISIDNLVLAINAGTGAGTNYGTGTVANPSVTAAKTNSSTMTVTAKVKGVVGNAIVIAESGTDLSWAAGAVLLSGGVDGTVGGNGAMLKDSSYLYITVAANTIADANWRRISVGSVY